MTGGIGVICHSCHRLPVFSYLEGIVREELVDRDGFGGGAQSNVTGQASVGVDKLHGRYLNLLTDLREAKGRRLWP